MQAGKHVVAWEVAAGLNGKAGPCWPAARSPTGTFAVHISTTPPQQSYVNNNGQIVTAR